MWRRACYAAWQLEVGLEVQVTRMGHGLGLTKPRDRRPISQAAKPPGHRNQSPGRITDGPWSGQTVLQMLTQMQSRVETFF